jgi:hypothetical protein
MRLRSLLFVACVLAASSAHAAPIFYTFTAVVDRSLLGASNGDIITGGLVFDDHAALVSYAEYPTPPDGLLTWDEPVTDATYDASDLILFFNIGDSFFSTHGAFLNIYNSPDGAWTRGGDSWWLQTELGVRLQFVAFFADILDNSALQGPPPVFVPDDTNHHAALNWFAPGSDAFLIATVTDITRVPEPATLTLLGIALLAHGCYRASGHRSRDSRRTTVNTAARDQQRVRM